MSVTSRERLAPPRARNGFISAGGDHNPRRQLTLLDHLAPGCPLTRELPLSRGEKKINRSDPTPRTTVDRAHPHSVASLRSKQVTNPSETSSRRPKASPGAPFLASASASRATETKGRVIGGFFAPAVASRYARGGEGAPKPGKQRAFPKRKQPSTLKKRILLHRAEGWRKLKAEIAASVTAARTPSGFTGATPTGDAGVLPRSSSSPCRQAAERNSTNDVSQQGCEGRSWTTTRPPAAPCVHCGLDPPNTGDSPEEISFEEKGEKDDEAREDGGGNGGSAAIPAVAAAAPRWAVTVRNLVAPEDIDDDDDDYEEVLKDVHDMVSTFNDLVFVGVPRRGEPGLGTVTIVFATHAAALDASSWFHGRVVGGKTLESSVAMEHQEAPRFEHAGFPQENPGGPPSPTLSSSASPVPCPPQPPQRAWEDAASVGSSAGSCGREADDFESRWRVVVRNLIEEDDVDDDENYEEVCSDIAEMLGRYGSLAGLHVPRELASDGTGTGEGLVGDVVATFALLAEAEACARGMDGRRIGGRDLTAEVLESAPPSRPRGPAGDNDLPAAPPPEAAPPTGHDTRRRRNPRTDESPHRESPTGLTATLGTDAPDWSLDSAPTVGGPEGADAGPASARGDGSRGWCVVIGDLIEEEDLVDDEDYDEAVKDVAAMAGAFGRLLGLRVPRRDDDREGLRAGEAAASFDSLADAEACASGLDGRLVGGRPIRAELRRPAIDAGPLATPPSPPAPSERRSAFSSGKGASRPRPPAYGGGTQGACAGCAARHGSTSAAGLEPVDLDAGPFVPRPGCAPGRGEELSEAVFARETAPGPDSAAADGDGGSGGKGAPGVAAAGGVTADSKGAPPTSRRGRQVTEKYREMAALPKLPKDTGRTTNAYVDQVRFPPPMSSLGCRAAVLAWFCSVRILAVCWSGVRDGTAGIGSGDPCFGAPEATDWPGSSSLLWHERCAP